MSSSDISSYNLKKWKNKGNIWLYDVNQKDPDWLLVRKGRPSGSNCGYLLGHQNTNFGSKEDTVLEITGKKEKIFSPASLAAIKHGNISEPISIKWYENTRNVIVEEWGFVVPKWDLYIGVSVDGVVLNSDGSNTGGMIEIKAPLRMYAPLVSYIQNQKDGLVKDGDFSHIWKTHYDQMQLGMAVLGKNWCDYIVYCSPENSVFVQRIPFDQNYWNSVMYNSLKIIIQNDILPLLEGTPFPLMPPESDNI